MEQQYWLSPLGGFDDFDFPYKKVMYDAKTKRGPWANMSAEAWAVYGCGKLGTGYGQKYELQDDNRWLKVEG